MIDDVVRSLPDISSHVLFLRRLGTMHADVDIQQRLLELMGPVFCNTVRPLLLVQGKWSMKVSKGYYNYNVLHMYKFSILTTLLGLASILNHPKYRWKLRGFYYSGTSPVSCTLDINLLLIRLLKQSPLILYRLPPFLLHHFRHCLPHK